MALSHDGDPLFTYWFACDGSASLLCSAFVVGIRLTKKRPAGEVENKGAVNTDDEDSLTV